MSSGVNASGTYGVSDVRVSFDGVDALHGVDLDVPAGAVTAVVGGDGAGKSTLLRCLVGKVVPAAGTVRRPQRRLVGYMPSTSGTWRQLTVIENIEFVGGVFGMSSADIARRRDDLLDRARLTAVSNRLAGDLSGGMRQKLGFVLAVLHEPELLVLDEPSTGVDPVSRVELWRLIARAAAGGAAVALATSYLDEAERASTVTVLDHGGTIVAGTRDEIMGSFPGSIAAATVPTDPTRSWRRGRSIREWYPEDAHLATGVSALSVDDLEFEDVVIARLLHDRQRTDAPTDGAVG